MKQVIVHVFTTTRGIRVVSETMAVPRQMFVAPVHGLGPHTDQLRPVREVLWRVAPDPNQLDIYFADTGEEGFVHLGVWDYHKVVSTGRTWLVVQNQSRISVFGETAGTAWRVSLTSGPDSYAVENILRVHDSPHNTGEIDYLTADGSFGISFEALFDLATGERAEELGSFNGAGAEMSDK